MIAIAFFVLNTDFKRTHQSIELFALFPFWKQIRDL